MTAEGVCHQCSALLVVWDLRLRVTPCPFQGHQPALSSSSALIANASLQHLFPEKAGRNVLFHETKVLLVLQVRHR